MARGGGERESASERVSERNHKSRKHLEEERAEEAGHGGSRHSRRPNSTEAVKAGATATAPAAPSCWRHSSPLANRLTHRRRHRFQPRHLRRGEGSPVEVLPAESQHPTVQVWHAKRRRRCGCRSAGWVVADAARVRVHLEQARVGEARCGCEIVVCALRGEEVAVARQVADQNTAVVNKARVGHNELGESCEADGHLVPVRLGLAYCGGQR